MDLLFRRIFIDTLLELRSKQLLLPYHLNSREVGMMLARVLIKSTKTDSTALISNGRVFPVVNSFSSLLKLSPLNYTDFAKQILEDKSSQSFSMEDVELLAPVTETPYTVYCIGKNYLDHVNEVKGTAMGKGVPTIPIVFSKAMNSINRPYGDITLPLESTSKQTDYEGELGIVIGKSGKNIKPENAFDHIFGVTIINDVTARDKQKRHLQWLLGKSLDGFCPIGPYVVPLQNVVNQLTGEGLRIETKVNGDLRQNGNTNDLIFDIPTLISVISEDTTLQVGDLIATGTPKGVGAGFDPPKYLSHGDVVSVQISEIGHIENTFIGPSKGKL